MLIKAQQWISETFVEGSRPTLQTVKRWFRQGEIDGVMMGKTLFIETEAGRAFIGKEAIRRQWTVKKPTLNT